MNKIYTLLSLTAILFSCTGNDGKKEEGATSDTTFSVANKKVTVYTTAQNSQLRITKSAVLEFKPAPQPLETEPAVFIDAGKTFQTIVGIGGAITDASAETFARLPTETQKEFLTAYFDQNRGIGYTLARTNINSCEFSSGSYTYVEDNDKELKTFNIAHDEQFKIPMIKRAVAAAGGKLPLYVSPWSPPAWMKDNNNML
ncbi:MAG: glycosyl hydrolase, partial [Chitinophagaceae bacterium]